MSSSCRANLMKSLISIIILNIHVSVLFCSGLIFNYCMCVCVCVIFIILSAHIAVPIGNSINSWFPFPSC